MSLLLVLNEGDPSRVLLRTSDPQAIAERLGARGLRFERWRASRPLPASAGEPEVLEAYAADVERIRREGGYTKVDVVRLSPAPEDPAWPERARAARAKFLDEHTHAEDEIRFFVEGTGLFYLRLPDAVHLVLCEQGDLLSVPAGTRHWFDMGTSPRFCAIRFFRTPDGWVGHFTGDRIAARFPSYDEVAGTRP